MKTSKIDFEKLLAGRVKKKLPRIVVKLLKKILRIDDINALFENAPGKKNLDFIDSCMEQLRFSCHVIGKEYLPESIPGEKLIFVCNHPQGGSEAICIAHVLGHQYNGKIKFYANEFLTILEPLKEMFLPIHRHQLQNRESIRMIREFYQSDNHLIVFPAGITASRSKGKIEDHEWQKTFIKTAVEYQRNVVPLYFEARNSNLFYTLENFRRLIRSKVSFEVLLFGNEFFKQKGNSFKLYIGKPICWQIFDKKQTYQEWADQVRQQVLDLPDQYNK